LLLFKTSANQKSIIDEEAEWFFLIIVIAKSDFCEI